MKSTLKLLSIMLVVGIACASIDAGKKGADKKASSDKTRKERALALLAERKRRARGRRAASPKAKATTPNNAKAASGKVKAATGKAKAAPGKATAGKAKATTAKAKPADTCKGRPCKTANARRFHRGRRFAAQGKRRAKRTTNRCPRKRS